MAIGGVILCVGDSLTYGARDEKGLHYPEMLARKLSKTFGQYWTAVNHGISGETSAQILRRFYGHVHAYPEAAEVMLWAGFNDGKVNVKTGLVDYEDNMESMIRSALFAGRAVYLFDLPYQEGFGAPDFMNNNMIAVYNKVIWNLWKKYNADSGHRMYPVHVADIPGEYRNDGIHLTHEGNKWVAERAFESVMQARQR